MKKLNLKQPIYVSGKPATVVYVFPKGNFIAVVEGEQCGRQFDWNGRPTDGWRTPAVNDEPTTTEVVTLYPNGAVYLKDQPVGSSSYGVDQLIQVRVTRRGDRIIHKELLP